MVKPITDKKLGRRLKGIVVSDKMEKSIVVKVETKKPHPKYGKIIKSHKKYIVHDENNEYKIGDMVTIYETSPMSKNKCWKILNKNS